MLVDPASFPSIGAVTGAAREVRDAQNSDVREIFARRGAPSATITGSRALRVVALWWWVLPVAGIPRWIGAALSFFLVALGLVFLARARASLERRYAAVASDPP